MVLDSETTGLGNPIDFVEVGVVSGRGEPLFDSLIEPSCTVDARASRVHGYTSESLAGERRFFEVYPDLLDVLWAKRVVVYNASYDSRVWDAAVRRLGARAALARELAPWECAMRAFAAYVGERSQEGRLQESEAAWWRPHGHRGRAGYAAPDRGDGQRSLSDDKSAVVCLGR